MSENISYETEKLDPLVKIHLIKEEIAAIPNAPLAEHGERFDRIHQKLNVALSDIEGI